LPFWRISFVILLFSTLFNCLTAHVGRTVILSLPDGWPLIGGPLTAEAAVYGFLNGLRLVTLLSFFLAFNTIVPVSDLTGLIPGALHEIGVVMLIAITYIPETARQFGRIRDAQAIRGHRLKGLKDWQPIVLPLLIGGLERALNLSETMVARGFGSTVYVRIPLRARLLMLAGLMIAMGGALRLLWGAGDGQILLGLGVLAVGIAYIYLSRLVRRTRYRPRRWRAADTLLVVGAVLSLILFFPAFRRAASLTFAVYPQLSPPPFYLPAGLVLLGLAIPAIIALVGQAPSEARE
jgi:energy-coupling factor transport system permease protein